MYMEIKTKNSGVYQIICNRNQKIYIGSAVNLSKRIKRHLFELRNKKHPSKHLQNAFNLYGEETFSVIVLEEYNSITRDNLVLREQYYLDNLKPYDRNVGYNTCPIAKSPAHLALSEEHRKNISSGLKNHYVSQETRDKIGNAHRGKTMSSESIEKIRLAKIGVRQTEENISKRAKSYSFIKDGIIYQGTNLKRFAKEHKCHRPNLNLVLKGVRKSHHGFMLYGHQK